MVGKGTTTIKATYKYANKTYTDSFVFEATYQNFSTNEDSTLYVVNTDENPSSLELKMFGEGDDITALASFVSSNPNVAYISNGRLFAKSEGSAVITASYVFGDVTYTASFIVNVVDNTPVLSTNSDTTLYTIPRTESTPVSASLILKNNGANVINANGVYWTSSNENVCKVFNNTITSVGAGDCQITAYYPYGDNVYSVSFNVTVIDNAPVLTINSDSTIYLLSRANQPNFLTLSLTEGNIDWTNDATFVSNAPSIVVIENGKAVSKASGVATITGSVVICGNTYSKTFNVTVVDNTPILTTNTDSNIYLYNRENEPNFINLFLREGDIDLTSLASFSSSNPSKVAIENGQAIAVSAGSAVITASITLDGVYYSKYFTVTVIENLPNLSVNDNTSIYLYEDGENANSVELIARLGFVVDLTDSATFVSSDTSKVIVENGKAVAVGVGSATITATAIYEGYTFTESFIVTVIDNTPNLTINDNSSIYLNDFDTQPNSLDILVKCNGEDVTELATFDISSHVVAIEGTTVVAKRVGKSTVTAFYEFGGKIWSTSFEVTVVDNTVFATVNGISGNSVEIHSNGIYGNMTASIGVSSVIDGALACSLSADREGIVSISGNTITALTPGDVVISVNYTIGSNNYVEFVDVKVIADIPDLVTLEDTELYIYGNYQGDYPDSATLFLTDGGVDVTSKATFVSSDSSVAKVSGTTLTAVSDGEATITACYTVAGITHYASFNVNVHGVNTVTDETLVSVATGKVQGILDAEIVSATYNGADLTVSNGVITSGLTANVSSASELFVITTSGVYSFTNVLVYDNVIYTEDEFINFFKSHYTTAQLREQLLYSLENYNDVKTYRETETITGQIALANDIDITKTLTTWSTCNITNDEAFYDSNGTKLTGTYRWYTDSRQFTGTFDGRGHVVDGLTIEGYYGIFGKVVGGTIKNVAFTNVKFNADTASVLGYSADTNSTISNVLVEVAQVYGTGHKSGALFYTVPTSSSDSGTAYYTDILVSYPDLSANDISTYIGGTLFGYITNSTTLYSNRFTNVYVLSKTTQVASINAANVFYAGNDSTPSGYSTTFKLDGGRKYSFMGAYRATVTRYNDFASMLNAGIYKVGTWSYDNVLGNYIYQDGAPVVESLSDLTLISGETLDLYFTVNGNRMSGGSFTSANASVASISGTTLTAVSEGTSTITASYTFGGTTYSASFVVTVIADDAITVTDETLVSIEDGTILGFDEKIVSARQDDVQLTIENGVITNGLTVKTEKEVTSVNGQTSTNDNVIPSTLVVFTESGAVYTFTNALVYTKVITTAEEAFDIFSTYNDGEYGITTGYFALANNIDTRELGIIQHVATGTRLTAPFDNSFTVTDSNGNTLVKQLGFQGYLDGRGYYLSFNATMGGLFGRLRSGSVVKNIALRSIQMPVHNAADYFNNAICFNADIKGSNVLIKDVYVEIDDLSSKALGNRSSAILNRYYDSSYAYLKNVVVSVPKPTEEGDNPSFGYGALFVRDDYFAKGASGALENVYVISGEKMPIASLLGTTENTYVAFAGNETATTFEGAVTVYKYTETQVLRYDSFDAMLGSAMISSRLGSADVWNNFHDSDYDLRINGVETTSLNLFTNDTRTYRDHATVYAYLNAKKISATFVSSNEDVVVYENEQFVAKGVGSANVTVSYNGVAFATVIVTVKDVTLVKSQDDFAQILANPNGIFVLEKDILLDKFEVPASFEFTGTLDGQGQSIKGSAVSSVLGTLNGACVQNVAFKLESGNVIASAINSYMDNVCVVGDMNTNGITVTNSIINYVEFDTEGDRSGFNRDYWDFTYGLEWKFRITYQGTHILDYTVTDNFIVENGESDYILLLPDDANERSQLVTARAEFIRLFRRATGIKLEAYFESSTAQVVQDAIESGKYISIGDTNLLAESGVEVPENLGVDGSIIRTVGNSVYIVGGGDYGSLYGVYNFMTICFEFEPYYKDCVVINSNVSELKLYNFDVTDIPDFATRASNHGFTNSVNADIIIDGVTYSESSEKDNAVGSDGYNTIYTDANLFTTRTRTTSSYREVMTILADQLYTIDDNGMIDISSIVDISTGELITEEAIDVRDRLVRGKSVNGTSIHNTSEYFPYDLNCYDDRGNPLEDATLTQEIYLSDRTPASVSSSTSYRMICFTAHGDEQAYNNLVKQFANKIIQSIILYGHSSLSHKDTVIIMNEDNGLHCDCEACLASIEKYGARSGTEIKFSNDVYDLVAEWLESIKDDPVLGRYYKKDFKICYSPYGASSIAPIINGRPTIYARDNVGMFLCVSRTLDYTEGIYDAINDAGRNDLMKDWRSVASKCMYWLYQTDFSSYMSFYNTTESFNSEAYQLYANFGGTHFSAQSQSGQDGSATAFHALQAYVNNKLRWDTNLDVNTLVDEYFTAMYGSDVNEEGSSAWYMKKMFTEVVDASNEFWDKYNLHKAPSHNTYLEERAYWTIEKIARWLDYCDKAIENANRTVDTSYAKDTVIRHVRMEKLFPLYMAIVTQRTAYSEADYYAMIAEFKDIVNQVGIGDYAESSPMSSFIATLPTATFETSNVSGSYSIGTEIPVSITMKLSDRVSSSEAAGGKTVRITSSNTDCAVVEGTNVKIVGAGMSVITVEFMKGVKSEYSYTFTVASGLEHISGLVAFSAYNGSDANDEERKIDASLFDGDIVSVKDELGNELLDANGEVNIENNTNKEIYKSVVVTDSLGKTYLVDLVVYTRFIYDASDFTEIFLQPEYNLTVRQYVLKNGAAEAECVGTYNYSSVSGGDEYSISSNSKKYFAFQYEMQEGDVRQNDVTSVTAKDITGAYALRADIDGVNTNEAFGYNMKNWTSVANANNMSSSGDNLGFALSGTNFFYYYVHFTGTLDGMGYSITNATIGTQGGLFGRLTGATIKNIGIEDVVYTDGNQSVFAYVTNNATVFENVYVRVKSFATYGGYVGNRQSVFACNSTSNVAGWQINNVLVEAPEIATVNNYGGGIISFLAHSTNGMPVANNLVVVSATNHMSLLNDSTSLKPTRVWLAENDSGLASTTFAGATVRIVKGALRYADATSAQSAGVTQVGSWKITYSNGAMTVNYVK